MTHTLMPRLPSFPSGDFGCQRIACTVHWVIYWVNISLVEATNLVQAMSILFCHQEDIESILATDMNLPVSEQGLQIILIEH
jgi:hypothetical protein